MKKQIKVGGMSLDIPEHDARIGSLVEAIQTAYEKGQVKGLLIVSVGDSGIQSAVAAPPAFMPAVAMAGCALCERVLEGLHDHFRGDDHEFEDE